MTRNLKILGVALVAMLALSAVTVSAATAADSEAKAEFTVVEEVAKSMENRKGRTRSRSQDSRQLHAQP